jgi:AcrR family transcriptional regulator
VSARAARRELPAPAAPRSGPSPFAPVGLRERQRAATRERLFKAALAEFRSQGFARANVSRIARAARVSRPSFYAHFPTLEHVLYELAWRLSLEIVRRLESASGLREALDRLVEGLASAEATVGDAALFRDMVSLFARRTVVLELEPEKVPVLGALLRRFEAARAAGELRPGMPPAQAARLCLSGVYGHLLGVDATPAERRADLRALFSLHLADPR